MDSVQPVGPTDALIVVDVQYDFLPPDGALAVPKGEEVLPAVTALMRLPFGTVVCTQDWHPPQHISFSDSPHAARLQEERRQKGLAPREDAGRWPTHCVQGTRGASLHASVEEIPSTTMVLRKGTQLLVDSYSAFRDNSHAHSTGLAGFLRARGVKRVFVCGLAYDVCVRDTAIDAVEEGRASVATPPPRFDAVIIVEEACKALTDDLDALRQQLRAAGVTIVSRVSDIRPKGGEQLTHARL